MTPDHENSARIHAHSRMMGRKMGTFGTKGGEPEPEYQPTSGAHMLPPTDGQRQAEQVAGRHQDGGKPC